MLNVLWKPHRAGLRAGTDEPQKIFAMLKLLPAPEVARARPPLAIALVVDTSGSMREPGEPAHPHRRAPATKLQRAIQAAHALLDDARLQPSDSLALIHFNDDAHILLPMRALGDKTAAHRAVDALASFDGSTQLARGLNLALQELSSVPGQAAKRVLVLTDGQTFDEPQCRPLAAHFASLNAGLVAIGVGETYNEILLRDLAQDSGGRPYHLRDMSELSDVLDLEIGQSAREVVTDLQASLSLVKGVKLDSLARVYPSLAEVDITQQPYRLGNVAAGDYTVWTWELTVAGVERPASRARVAQLGLAGYAPGLNRHLELPVQDLMIDFAGFGAPIDPEVLGYVQQKNVDRMVQRAVGQASNDAGEARATLQAALGLTQRLGNAPVTQMLENALDELNQTGTLSPGTRKTISLSGRTRTVKTAAVSPLEGVPSDEEIRRLTGA